MMLIVFIVYCEITINGQEYRLVPDNWFWKIGKNSIGIFFISYGMFKIIT